MGWAQGGWDWGELEESKEAPTVAQATQQQPLESVTPGPHLLWLRPIPYRTVRSQRGAGAVNSRLCNRLILIVHVCVNVPMRM